MTKKSDHPLVSKIMDAVEPVLSEFVDEFGLRETIAALLEGYIEDSGRIQVLERMLAQRNYTGRAILRWSTNGRGMRLAETSWKGNRATIRDAIDVFVAEHTSLMGKVEI